MTAKRFELPDRAKTILEREETAMVRQAGDALKQLTTPTSALTASCELLTVRRRYMGQVGEHFSVQDHEGIVVVDHLDESLLRALHGMLEEYLKKDARPVGVKVRKYLAGRMAPQMHKLPQFPVAFQVLYVLRKMFEALEEILEEGEGGPTAEIETAFALQIRDMIQKYLQTRDKPLHRHLSDVEREYSVVSRLKCGCGTEKYRVTMQSLQTGSDSVPFDRLDIQCGTCGTRRTIDFDLPYFRDLYSM